MVQQVVRGSPCRNCSHSVDVTAEEIERILHQFVTRRKRTLVDRETAAARLALCLQCEAYGAGGTCQHCGCLVEVKTQLMGERCPNPASPKW